MIQLEDAQRCISTFLKPLAPESIALGEAFGRFVAEPISAPTFLPPFDNSAMDGFAVRAEDVQNASGPMPVALRVIGQTAAGQVFPGAILPQQCVRVFTGSALPRGADAVVMQEDSQSNPSRPNEILILDSIKPWENVRLRGEDVNQGQEVLAAGARLTVARLALLGALGLPRVQIHRRPVVGLIATGSELREPGQSLHAGQIYESNRLAIGLLTTGTGSSPKSYPLVPDDLAATQNALSGAFTECDVVLTSGGASVGELDFVKTAFQQLGGELNFWRVSMKPGKPFVFGRWQNKLLFGLPGNPVSAMVTFLVLVRPALLRMQGATQTELPASRGELLEPLVNRGDRRHFMRVHLDRSGWVRPVVGQASHLLRALADANGLVDVPPGTSLPTGTLVSVLQWDSGLD